MSLAGEPRRPGVGFLRSAAVTLALCGIAHLIGHFSGIAKIPVEGPERDVMEMMQRTAVPGPLLDPSLFGLLKGFSLFFSLALFVVAATTLGWLRRGRDSANVVAAQRLLLAFCLPALAISLSYFIVPPQVFLTLACGLAIVGSWRARTSPETR
jgi:hypothetical protein